MKLLTLSLILFGLTAQAKDKYKANCEYEVGGSVFSESATVSAPLLNHDFRIRFFDHEGEQAMTGRCYIFGGEEAECYDKDMYGNDDDMVIKMKIYSDERITTGANMPNEFYLSFKDEENQYALLRCSKQK